MQQIFFWLLIGGFVGSVGMFAVSLITQKRKEQWIRDIYKEKSQILENDFLERNRRESALLQAKEDFTKEQDRRVREREEQVHELETRLADSHVQIENQKKALWEKELLCENLRSNLTHELSRVSGLDESTAREFLLSQTQEKIAKDLLGLYEKKRKDTEIRSAEISKEILIKSIQQYAGDVTAETTQTLIHLESDDIKGKLIGKEGRNIIAFERATGVSLIIDDTPDTVFISSFDLFRRYIAKQTLEELITDKRIQPARIEEIAEKCIAEAEKVIYDLGLKTVQEMGIHWIPDEIIPLIGKFRFRTSYGQNILLHSKEVAYIAEAIAKLIWADTELAFKGGLLHDIWKSLDHDIEGTHPELGGKIARKYGLDERLVNIIEGHHDGVPQICIETKIVQIADAISATRPGARRMNADEYIKRVSEMENIALSFSGVSRAFALSAGREVRVFVDATTISDIEAQSLARDIAVSIEENLTYPGEIKVNLIRETRVIEYAR